MQTFEEKSRINQQAASAKTRMPAWTHFGHRHEVNSLLHLQHTIGNQAVQRMLQRNAEADDAAWSGTNLPRFSHDINRIPVKRSADRGIQTQLAISKPRDECEQEADQIAGRVIDMPEPNLQRDYGADAASPKIKSEQLSQAKELLQAKHDNQAGVLEPLSAPPVVHKVLPSAGQPLDAGARAFMQPRFGYDFSRVRVHTDARASAAAQTLRARAFTLGNDIAFDRGEYAPQSRAGRRLLGHELTHVIQQNIGLAAHQVLRTPSSIPFEERADDTCTATIERFIELVETEEARYPLEEQRNTRLMLTRLRKIFYGKDGWDTHLIAGASSVERPYQTSETERDRFDVPLPFAPDVTVTARDYSVIDPATGRTPEIARSQEVRLPNGTCIDLGHVFAGLDAINHPQVVDGPGTVNITSNVDAVTWVGDLGSVLAEAQFEYIRGGQTMLTEAQKQAIIDEYAPGRDMLGNIDAYVIGDAFSVGCTGNTPTMLFNPGRRATSSCTKVSEILRQYYLGARGTTGGDARAHRYSTFATAIGLTGWDGANFSNEASWLDNYTDEVNDAAALYIGANTRGWWNPARYGAALGMSANGGARGLLLKFLAELKLRIAAESP